MTPGLANSAQQLWTRYGSEIKRICIFASVGVTSLLLNIGLYTFATRVLFPAANHTPIYVAVTIIITWVNYLLNKRLTFSADTHYPGVMGRFAGVAVMALGLNAFLFWLGHDVLHLYDLFVIIGNTLIVAIFTFTSHRQFTFHPKPWRHFKQG